MTETEQHDYTYLSKQLHDVADERDELRQSRDELLEECKVYLALVHPGSYSLKFRTAIQKAEAAKEKETK